MRKAGGSTLGSHRPALGDELLKILQQYLSPINAQGILSRSIARVGGKSRVDETNLAQVTQRLQASAGLFISSEHRDDFQSQLEQLRKRALNNQTQTEREQIPIEAEGDIVVARTRARILCEGLGSGGVAAHKVATVVSELARNIVSYTPGGLILLSPGSSPPTITIEASDRGTGIPGLNSIMAGDYRSKTGLGLGLSGSKKLAESFVINTGPGGTTIVARMNI